MPDSYRRVIRTVDRKAVAEVSTMVGEIGGEGQQEEEEEGDAVEEEQVEAGKHISLRVVSIGRHGCDRELM